MNCHEIIKIEAMQVFTERSHPGIKATVTLADGTKASAVCTAGNSIGAHEIPFLYDGGTRWNGIGVEKAAHNIEQIIAPELYGMDASDQFAVDQKMIEHKSAVGGNAVAAVSASVLKAGAASLGIPLYKHMGGESAVYLPVPGAPAVAGHNRYGGGVTTPDLKPTMSFVCYDYATFSEASYAGWEVQTLWEEEAKQLGAIADFHFFQHFPVGVFKSDEELFELMTKCIDKTGHTGKMGIQMDVAGTCYYEQDTGIYRGLFGTERRTTEQLLAHYVKMVKDFPIVIIEDPFFEDDYEAHAALTRETDIQIVGDDLFTTMTSRVRHGASLGAANTLLLKVNQIGTISESLDAVQEAYRLGYNVMPSESRGEGADIADYCVGIGAGSVREGATGDTAANRFLEIERELGARAKFQGKRGLMGSRFR